ncbi:MAG: hypothetical protein EZS28_047658, partial [Streblomastix strix]
MLRTPIALRDILASEVVEQQRERMLKNKLKATALHRTLTGVKQRRLDNGEDNLEEVRDESEGLICKERGQ